MILHFVIDVGPDTNRGNVKPMLSGHVGPKPRGTKRYVVAVDIPDFDPLVDVPGVDAVVSAAAVLDDVVADRP